MTNSALDKFINSYAPMRKGSEFRYTTMVRHKGTVIAFASDSDRRIWYTVLDLSNSEIDSPLDVNYWLPEPKELFFPSELIKIRRDVAGSLLSVPEVKIGDKRNHFESTTARLTEDAPFQVLSDGHYVYLFRQSFDDGDAGDALVDEHGNQVLITGQSLLVDRFVFVSNELMPKTEVRFQRSRRKDRPLNRKDSLNSKDMEGHPFYEPTGELSMVRNLSGGRFTVLLLPTTIPGVERWQIFAYNDNDACIDSYNIERATDGLFNLQGTVYYTSPDEQYQNAVFETKPGTCPFTGLDLIPTSGSEGYAGRALSSAKTNYIGNVKSGELHDADCVYIEQMNAENKAPYPSVAAALQHNDHYDPCGVCQPFDKNSVTDIIADYVPPGESYLELGVPKSQDTQLDANLTIEMWIKPNGFGQEKLLFGKVRGATGMLSIDDSGFLHYFYGTSGTDEAPYQEYTMPTPLLADRWTHVAIVRDLTTENGSVQWIVDGVAIKLDDQTVQFSTCATTEDTMILGRDFHGLIDELRLWDCARSRSDIEANMGSSLEPNSENLVGYWRFDELNDEANGIIEQTDKWQDAMFHGDATLAASDAPIVQSVDLKRRFSFTGCRITGGLSALLYYQQEQMVTGYNSEAKPLKTSGRVMLAIATDSVDQADHLNANRIAVLDLGVSRFGQLVMLPQTIDLIRIEPPEQQSRIDDLVAEIADLQQRIDKLQEWARLDRQIASLEGEISALGNDKTRLENKLAVLNNDIANIDAQFDKYCRGSVGADDRRSTDSGSTVPIRPDDPASDDISTVDCDTLRNNKAALEKMLSIATKQLNKVEAQLQQKQAALQKAQDDKAAIEEDLVNLDPPQAYPPQAGDLFNLRLALYQKQAFLKRMSPVMPVINFDFKGLIAYGALLGFTATEDRPLLFDSVNGDINLYYRGLSGEFFAAYYTTQAGRALYRLPLKPKGYVYMSARHCGTDMDNITIRVENYRENNVDIPEYCRLIIGNDKLGITETWNKLPRGIEQFVNVLNGQPAGAVGNAGAYDYATRAYTNRTGWNLNNGSLLFFLYSPESGGSVDNTHPALPVDTGINSPVLACRWLTRASGYTLAFDGNDSVMTDNADSLAVDGDFTIEAWVKPRPDNTHAALVQKASSNSNYSVELIYDPDYGAITLGYDGVVELDEPVDLGDRWTIEARFKYPLAVNKDPLYAEGYSWWNTLTHGTVDTQVIFCSATSELGTDLSGAGNVFTRAMYYSGITPGWHHVAAVGENGQTVFYIDGTYLGTAQAQSTSDVKFIGNSEGGGQAMGTIDEIRVWSKARTRDEIDQSRHIKELTQGDGLVACWRFYDGEVIDCSGHGHSGTLKGAWSTPIDTCMVGIDANYVQAQSVLPANKWSHIAAVYTQSYALSFDGKDDTLNCGTNQSLNLCGDLTLEVFFQIDSTEEFTQALGILSKGCIGGARNQNTPYALSINQNQQLVFAFEDCEHDEHAFTSDVQLQPGVFYRVGVTRKTEVSQTTVVSPTQGEIPIVQRWERIRFVIVDAETGGTPHVEVHKFTGKSVGKSNEALEFGKSYRDGKPIYFHGAISELRIWNKARDKEDLTFKISGEEEGLVSWWHIEEGEGPLAKDAVANNYAKCRGARWVKNPDPFGSAFQMYKNGEPISSTTVAPPALAQNGFRLGDGFFGEMDELRIWKTARTQEQIQDNMFCRLLGEKEDLVAYYQFDAAAGDTLPDHSGRERDLTLDSGSARPRWTQSTAPVGFDTPQVRNALIGIDTQFNRDAFISASPVVQEYGDMQYDADGELTGSMKRCYSVISDKQWQLITGFKVGDLMLEWIGQAQSKPQLVGYIEGAPPVPSENLTNNPDGYEGASSIELVQANSVVRGYTNAMNHGFDTSLVFVGKVGYKSESEAGIGVATEVEEVKALLGAKSTFELSNSVLDETVIEHGTRLTHMAASELTGTMESETSAYFCGRRYIPNNEGLALVLSDTYDVFALRLKHNSALVAFRMLPNPDIPRDWNIISFPMNRLYINQGSLDGKVGFDANGSVQWDEPYSNYNLPVYGEYSYFKPREAYELKKRIEREESQLSNYYQNLDLSMLNIAELLEFGPRILDFAQKPKLRGLPKRNIANTYVWTAAGGFFAESTETMSTFQRMSGRAIDLKFMAGGVLDIDITVMKANFSIELELLAGLHLNLTETKHKNSEASYSLNLNLDVERDIQNTMGKVDAYRFMSFFLQPSLAHFEEFVNKVVDQDWLWNSDDSNAVALREAVAAQKEAKKPEDKSVPWRVLHRVTYVSRVLPSGGMSRGVSTGTAGDDTPLETALSNNGFQSSYELALSLEPEVGNHSNDLLSLNEAVRKAVQKRLPNLTEEEEKAVIEHMSNYYLVLGE